MIRIFFFNGSALYVLSLMLYHLQAKTEMIEILRSTALLVKLFPKYTMQEH